MIQLEWEDGQWGDGISDEIVDELMDHLANSRRVLPDVVRVFADEPRQTNRSRKVGVPVTTKENT
jgi:hypothetical protein